MKLTSNSFFTAWGDALPCLPVVKVESPVADADGGDEEYSEVDEDEEEEDDLEERFLFGDSDGDDDDDFDEAY